MYRRLFSAAALPLMLVAACAQTGQQADSPPVTREAGTDLQAAAAERRELPAEPREIGTLGRPFSADSPWNTPIPADPRLDPLSDVLVENFADTNALFINIAQWTVTVKYFDSEAAPRRRVRALYPGRYGAGFGPSDRVPLPDDAVRTGVSAADQFYVTLVDPRLKKAWDLFQAGRDERGEWFAGFGAEVDLSGSGVAVPWMQSERPDRSAGVRPSGIPLLAGLIRADEVRAGRIEHALAMAIPAPRAGVFVPPASTALDATPERAGRDMNLPMGARLQLNPDYDIENTLLSPGAKVVARALQEYGAIIVDESGATTLFAEGGPDHAETWDGLLQSGDLQLLFTPDFMAEHFRVIASGDKLPGRPVAQD